MAGGRGKPTRAVGAVIRELRKVLRDLCKLQSLDVEVCGGRKRHLDELTAQLRKLDPAVGHPIADAIFGAAHQQLFLSGPRAPRRRKVKKELEDLARWGGTNGLLRAILGMGVVDGWLRHVRAGVEQNRARSLSPTTIFLDVLYHNCDQVLRTLPAATRNVIIVQAGNAFLPSPPEHLATIYAGRRLHWERQGATSRP